VLVQISLLERIVGELEGALVSVLRFGARGQRSGPLGGANQHLARTIADLAGVGVVRRRFVCVDIVRRENLDDLVLLAEREEVGRRSEVQRLSLPAGERLNRRPS
jgi:hypothetical protein